MKVATELKCIFGLALVLSYSAYVAGSMRPPGPPTALEIQNSLQKLAMAIDTYYIDTGELPPDLHALTVDDRFGWEGPYLREAELLDPCGEPIRYRRSPEGPGPYVLESSCQGQSIRREI